MRRQQSIRLKYDILLTRYRYIPRFRFIKKSIAKNEIRVFEWILGFIEEL
jgi:hypothetical protein